MLTSVYVFARSGPRVSVTRRFKAIVFVTASAREASAASRDGFGDGQDDRRKNRNTFLALTNEATQRSPRLKAGDACRGRALTRDERHIVPGECLLADYVKSTALSVDHRSKSAASELVDLT